MNNVKQNPLGIFHSTGTQWWTLPASHPPRAPSPAVRLRVRAAAARGRRAAAFPARKVLREALCGAGPARGRHSAGPGQPECGTPRPG